VLLRLKVARPFCELDKSRRLAHVEGMTMFSFHTRFLLNAGNTLNRL